MQAVLARPAVSTSEPSSRRTFARVAGAILAICFLSVMAGHAGPAAIAGQRVSGTGDVGLIRTFYSHPAMVWFWWQGGISLLGLVIFGMVFRSYLRTFEQSPMAQVLTDAATALIVVESGLLAVMLGLQSAMVQLVTAGAPDGALLSVFAGWDWLYNSVTYWFEFGWMFMLAGVAYRAQALPAWMTIIGSIAAFGLLFNSTALLLRVPDIYTMIPTAFFAAWFVCTSVYLLRGGSEA